MSSSAQCRSPCSQYLTLTNPGSKAVRFFKAHPLAELDTRVLPAEVARAGWSIQVRKAGWSMAMPPACTDMMVVRLCTRACAVWACVADMAASCSRASLVSQSSRQLECGNAACRG